MAENENNVQSTVKINLIDPNIDNNNGDNNASNGNILDLTDFLPLTFLCSLIAKPFDGNRHDLPEFISNCENAFKFAKLNQIDALLAFIMSKITGSAKAQMRDKAISGWQTLKNLLLQLYSDTKNYTKLMEELNTIRQSYNETILSFYNRIDKISTRLLNTISFQNHTEVEGRSQTIKELALQRFILHSTSDISRFLRSKEPKTLSLALNSALEEERALHMPKFTKQNSHSKFCSFCKTKGHLIKDCYKK